MKLKVGDIGLSRSGYVIKLDKNSDDKLQGIFVTGAHQGKFALWDKNGDFSFMDDKVSECDIIKKIKKEENPEYFL